MNYLDHWRNKADLAADLKQQLTQYTEDQLHDAFYTRLNFGTAGMRGLLGPGPNRINVYTVGRANIGFGKYLLSKYPEDTKVAIAYDNRHYSKELAMVCAKTLAQLGIESYLFEDLRPTPELSFAVRHLQASGGIVITASHNPPEYNGYKVYDHTGRQLIPEEIDEVIHYIDEIEDELSIDFSTTPQQDQLIHTIAEDIDAVYKEAVLSIQLRPEQEKDNFFLVFSPQHGTAYPLMTDIFDQAGYHYALVEEQAFSDPDFINTATPNPEDRASYDVALEYAKKHQADLILVTDPDADRMGTVVYHEGKYEYLTGNQGGAILLKYIFETRKEKDLMPEDPVIFNTIVTSDVGEALAKRHGVKTEKTLTGFKFIGEKIEAMEDSDNYVFGYEESYGYLLAPFVRDKDALQACLMLAEAGAYYKSLGKTLVDVLYEVFAEVGAYEDQQVSLTLAGAQGVAQIQAIMKNFRTMDLKEFAGQKVVYFEDYLNQYRLDESGKNPLDFPAADVLKYGLEDGSWIAIRPSGTEPKCKFYYCVRGETFELATEKLTVFKDFMNQLME